MRNINKVDVYDVLAKTSLTVGQAAWLASAFIENPDGHGFAADDADVSVKIDSVELTINGNAIECGALIVRVLFEDPETGEIKIEELPFEMGRCFEGFVLNKDEMKWYDVWEVLD